MSYEGDPEFKKFIESWGDQELIDVLIKAGEKLQDYKKKKEKNKDNIASGKQCDYQREDKGGIKYCIMSFNLLERDFNCVYLGAGIILKIEKLEGKDLDDMKKVRRLSMVEEKLMELARMDPEMTSTLGKKVTEELESVEEIGTIFLEYKSCTYEPTKEGNSTDKPTSQNKKD